MLFILILIVQMERTMVQQHSRCVQLKYVQLLYTPAVLRRRVTSLYLYVVNELHARGDSYMDTRYVPVMFCTSTSTENLFVPSSTWKRGNMNVSSTQQSKGRPGPTIHGPRLIARPLREYSTPAHRWPEMTAWTSFCSVGDCCCGDVDISAGVS